MSRQSLDMNDPGQACLAGGGDCIVEVAQAAAKAIHKKAAQRKHDVIKIIDLAARETGVHPNFLWYALFRGPRQWPPNVNKDGKRLLRLLKEVYEASGATRPPTLDPLRGGNPGFQIPEESQIRKAFKIMVLATSKTVERPLLREWSSIVKRMVPQIQAKCEETFGLECDRDEAESMLYGDLQRLWAHRRLPVGRPELIRHLILSRSIPGR